MNTNMLASAMSLSNQDLLDRLVVAAVGAAEQAAALRCDDELVGVSRIDGDGVGAAAGGKVGLEFRNGPLDEDALGARRR